jgi:hypothetical protein
MAEQDQQITPFDFLQTFPGAPDQATIESWKAQAPGRRVRLYHSTDAKRAYVLRGISALELAQVQTSLPANLTPEKVPGALQNVVAIRCTIWASETPDHKLSELVLQASGAGLAQTLHEIVCQLSDYADPVTIERCSADL